MPRAYEEAIRLENHAVGARDRRHDPQRVSELFDPHHGTLAFGSKTISPLGISGLLKLTREIVDSSNPAIDAIALQAMRESYSQQTEVKLYTLLNGTSGAGGTITTDNVPSGAMASTTAGGTDNQTLAKHLRERLAKSVAPS